VRERIVDVRQQEFMFSFSPTKRTSRTRAQTTRQTRLDRYFEVLMQRLSLGHNASTDGKPCALGVTACGEGQGVSTVAARLAVAVAQSGGGPVVLVDASAQRPSVGKRFDAESSRGLADVLEGTESLFDCLVDSPIDDLSLLLPGASMQPTSCVDPTALEQLVDSLTHVFPRVIVDLPQAIDSPLCHAWAEQLDGVLLVIEAERVPPELAQRACQQLAAAKANVVGVVYNKSPRRLKRDDGA